MEAHVELEANSWHMPAQFSRTPVVGSFTACSCALDTKPCDGHCRERKGKGKGRRVERSLWRLVHLLSDEESAVSSILSRALAAIQEQARYGNPGPRTAHNMTKHYHTD